MKKFLHMGLDVGSTTVKLVIADRNYNIVYSRYQRHFSDIRNTIFQIVNEACERFITDEVTVMITGSGGISVSQWLKLDFIQEVVAGFNYFIF